MADGRSRFFSPDSITGRSYSPMSAGMSSTASEGMSPHMSRGMSPYVSGGMPDGMSRGMSDGMSRGMSDGMSRGMSDGIPRGMPGPYSDDGETTPQETASVNGSSMEVVSSRGASHRGVLSRRDTLNHRDQGALQARNRLWEDIANKMLPPEESELMLKYLEKGADERLRRTYVEGVAFPNVAEDAAVPRVGLTFLPGADTPQVTRLEQNNMAGGEPEQKDAMWRVNTAASLLLQFEVSSDLSIVQRYRTDETSAIANRARNHKNPIQRSISSASHPRGISNVPLFRGHEPITIDSDYVKIVHDLNKENWDLQSTLIEVDGSSLLRLMANYRHLISQGGPDMTFDETKTLLETMIEDARRLCVRSPVLFRMSTRAHIINSKHTRYGINHRTMFRTLTTSQGIKEIISLSASYYNSLDPQGSKDRTQQQIKPRFLQMIVLLLSLLNNDDLEDIAEFLVATYGLRAERHHLELLFLKVIPMISINSKVFLKSLIPAFDNFPAPPNIKDKHCWDVFVERILAKGYLLPGTTLQLGRDKKSWIVKWPEEGFKSTVVFRDLQFGASRERTINDIPPIEVHPDSSSGELTVIFTNGAQYNIGTADLEKITCLTPGAYSVQEARDGGRNYDLLISEFHINSDLNLAIRKTNALVQKLNQLSTFIKKGLRDRVFGRKENEITFLYECKSSGRITRSVADLNQDILAVTYKIEGRKITTRDAMRTMMSDIREMTQLLASVERRIQEIGTENTDKRQLRFDLDEIRNYIQHAERQRKELAESEVLSDEPIAKVVSTGSYDASGQSLWYEYHAWYTASDMLLRIDAKRSRIQHAVWTSDVCVEVRLVGYDATFHVAPLEPVLETERAGEIRRDDIAILVGQYMILAEPENENMPVTDTSTLYMSTYLRITSVDEMNATRRGRNRQQQNNSTVVSLFR